MDYRIPNLPSWVLRDAPVQDTDSSQETQRRLDTEDARKALTHLFGQDSPLLEAVEKHGVDVLKFVKGEQNMVDVFGITEADAQRLAALVNLSDQLHIKKRGSLWYIRNISDVQQACQPMMSLQREELRILLVNEYYQLIHEEVIATGSIDYLSVQPSEVLQPSVERRVPAFVLVHNHPTGDQTPSDADLAFTEKIIEATAVMGKTLLDHVVIAAGGVSSCLDALSRRSTATR